MLIGVDKGAPFFCGILRRKLPLQVEETNYYYKNLFVRC